MDWPRSGHVPVGFARWRFGFLTRASGDCDDRLRTGILVGRLRTDLPAALSGGRLDAPERQRQRREPKGK